MAEKKSLLSKRPTADLTRYLGLGSDQGARLARGERPAIGEMAALLEDARVALEEIEAKLAKSARLWEREWAAIGLRAVFRSVMPLIHDDPRARELEERAHEVREKLRALDKAEFAALHAELEAGTYGPQRFRADLATRPRFEWDAFTERLLAIEEVPSRETTRELDMVHYLASGVEVIFEIQQQLTPDDCFYDLGSGLGKVAILVAWLGGIRAKGVEYEPAYVRLACERAEKMHIDRVEFIQADARAVDYDDGTVFYMYDPFRGEILQAVLAKLEALSKTKPIRILARGETTKTLDALGWLEKKSTTHWEIAIFEPSQRRD
jgi:hypothetical protein